jgi:hypothetical protein
VIQVSELYQNREIRLIERRPIGGWRMKLYGISCAAGGPDPRLVASAIRLAAGVLPEPAVTPTRYGVGFMGVHEGRGSNLVFVDWWARENELHHHAWVSPEREFQHFDYVTPAGLAACVWDLAVIGFERQAWIDAVLAAPHPDFNRYLDAALEGSI